MKLLKALSENISEKVFILEYSEKIRKQLLDKFKTETDDNSDVILSYISDFQKIKDGLPSDQRDITKYNYNKLKNIIEAKKRNKDIERISTEIKKTEKGIDNNLLKQTLSKYFQIKDLLGGKVKKLESMKFLDLVGYVNKEYPKTLLSSLKERFIKEKPSLGEQTIMFYIQSYLDIMDEMPANIKPITLMNFDEFEHAVDAVLSKKQGTKEKQDVSDVEMIYDENNLKIFFPKTKDQCIKLRNGRGWCTSREGSGNMYYNYRLGNNRTLYYVIDEDLPFGDLNFAVVVLVDPDGGMSLADGSNSGRYSGHNNIPWSEIETKVPKLKGLRSLLKPVPLTSQEKELHSKYKSVRVGDNPTEQLGGDKQVEMWMEINSPTLNDTQYSNISSNNQKKYIGLGMKLSKGMIENSNAEVLRYYLSRQIDRIKSSNLNQLSTEDIALLNTGIMKKVKSDLKSHFAKSMVKQGNRVEITFPGSELGKFLALYGFEDFFNNLPNDLEQLMVTNTENNSSISYDIPPSLGKYTNLTALLLSNMVKSIPKEIGTLKNLNFLSLPNNPNLQNLPDEVSNCESLTLVNLENTPATLPKGMENKFGQSEGGFYWKTND